MKALIILALLTTLAHAGIRGVGLGGGHGEMQAFLADSKLPLLLAGIPDCEGWLSSDTRPLRPDPTCKAEPKPNAVYISSCDLYEFNPSGEILSAKPFNEIAAIVLSARSGRPLVETRNLLSGLKVRERSIAVSPTDAELKLRWMEASYVHGKFTSLMIEGARETVEIGGRVESALDCTENAEWSLSGLRAFGSAAPDHAVEAQVNWRCGDSSASAALRIFIQYQGGKISPKDVRVVLIRP